MFCPNCGNALNESTRFCASCGAAQRREDSASSPAPAAHASTRPAPRKPVKERIMDSLLAPVGVILILMGIASLSLSLVGRATTAQVTGYEQVLFINNDDSTRNPSRYKLEYAFSVGGERYTGSVTRVFPGGSHIRQTIPVRYLPFWPHVNAEDGKTAGFAGPAMAGAGLVVLVLWAKKRSRRRSKNRMI